MAGDNILITGGSGLVGANAARMLLDRGERPVLYDVALNERLLRAVGVDPAEIPVVRGDVADLPGIISALREHKIGRVLHLAAFLGEEVQRRPYGGVQLNLMGTVNVLEAARLEGIKRVVLSSSSTVFHAELGEGGPKKIDETIPLNPLSIYAATKASSEFLGRTYAKRFGFEFVTVRFAALYGPSPAGLKATREQAIQQMVRAALKGETATINWPYGPAELLYGKDAAKGAVLATIKDNLKENIFHIGTGQTSTGDDILAALKRHFPDARITLTRGTRPMPYPEDRIPHDLSRARERLGFEPDYLLDKALGDYAETLKKIEGL
ncbi:MAG TPA: NAD(P)-dependent oxidoreductase [Candidatus Binatia bacterium]|jgi:nucleoside-diphosphate-sugar epimerase|nr:NAD(P)-dependent oxidoreductase [Candidatus Binatia bacterium]